ncbi:MAG: thioredoxin domain-containing protein [Bacteroidetes bacterium]|jgi:hypothetical protein|nr:thioredoxin domain-containing protein [Bacteroidota bacterium]
MSTILDVIDRRKAGGTPPNRLINEKSPYLLQHAFNPVDWRPWGEEALATARREDKPIFLSIGYSACYWCHVMEREVFENPEIAALMNRTVVSIKVDREERPDVDRVYMAALMGMTGSGGWPMSMFLTPDLKPFFGGTYIPPKARYGREGFPDLLARIQELWTSDRGVILEAGERLATFLRHSAVGAATEGLPGEGVHGIAFDHFSRSHDHRYGGFGGAPKFPTPVVLQYLLRSHHATGEPRSLEMVVRTLDRMLDGGIHDHLGGGFHRYATDAEWHVPHFEKMLYDQAQLACVALEVFQITRRERYRAAVQDILGYVLRDLTGREGGFFSAEDAESARTSERPDDKHEGACYTWTKREIDQRLGEKVSELVAAVYDVRDEGNVKSDPHGVFAGLNILHVVGPWESAADRLGWDRLAAESALGAAHRSLLEARRQRPRPLTDDKVLLSWNGLMISAFARAGQALDVPAYVAAAERAASFIEREMIDPANGDLLRRYRAGEARFTAHLEDRAFYVQGLLDLYEATCDHRWLRRAVEITERQIDLLSDREAGGFFEDVVNELSGLVRMKEWHDGATPSANAVAATNLLRLSAMLHDDRYRDLADGCLRSAGGWIEQSPHGTAQWLMALRMRERPPRQVIVAGPRQAPHTQALLRLVRSRYDPHRVILLADGGEGQQYLTARDASFGSYRIVGGKPTAYVCEDFACREPTSDLATLERLLGGRSADDGAASR